MARTETLTHLENSPLAIVRAVRISVGGVVQGVGFRPFVFRAKIDVLFLRDATRGGVSAVLHQVAEAAGVGAVIEEVAVPLSPAVRWACELLGLDPLYVANEGKMVVVVAAEDAARTLACLRGHTRGAGAAIVGDIREIPKGEVLVRGPLGGLRVLDEPVGAPLPRIC